VVVQPGARIASRYRVLARVGEGGMGTVWSAAREDDGERVALKVLKAHGADATRRLVREARIAERLLHPNIVRVHEVVTLEGAPPVVVLELLEGESLRARLARMGALPIDEACRVVAHTALAVHHAHRQGVVHRDLKPENIFLHDRTDAPSSTAAPPIVKVLDFGIAKVVSLGGPHTAGMTETGTVLGTPHYMAPEQVFGEGDLDGRADVWALGVVLFECIAGRKPFDGDNAGQVFKQITMGAAPSLSAHCPSAPAPIVDLVRRMLSGDRSARPTLREVLEVTFRHAERGEEEALLEQLPPSTRRPAAAPVGNDLGAPPPSGREEPAASRPSDALVTPPAVVTGRTTAPSRAVPARKRGFVPTIAVVGASSIAAAFAIALAVTARSPERAPGGASEAARGAFASASVRPFVRTSPPSNVAQDAVAVADVARSTDEPPHRPTASSFPRIDPPASERPSSKGAAADVGETRRSDALGSADRTPTTGPSIAPAAPKAAAAKPAAKQSASAVVRPGAPPAEQTLPGGVHGVSPY
jgi:serine/threonine-protein kinase